MPKTHFNFKHEKFLSAKEEFIKTALTEIPDQFHQPCLLHLDAIFQNVHLLTGGKLTIDGVTASAASEMTDKSIIFIFDAIAGFSDKKTRYSSDELASLDTFKPAGSMSIIKGFISGDRDKIKKFLSETKGDEETKKTVGENFDTYCEHVVKSSQKLMNSMTEWLDRNSEINSTAYLADVKSATTRGAADNLRDKVLQNSQFAQRRSKEQETSSTSLVKKSELDFRPTSHSKLVYQIVSRSQ